jgi:diguanylate cyclase (GGDEF)-like protein/PAS domain S-box-containing protein
MVPIEDEVSGEGIFFVSFHLAPISTILQVSHLPGHELMLLFEPVDGLIEVHADGGRDVLKREQHLSDEEKTRVMESRLLHGTMWELIDLHEPGLLDDKYYQALSRYYGYLLLLVFMILSVMYSIRRENRYLASLRENNQQLEQRVKERTAELQSANERVKAIVDNTSDAIISIDSQQNIQLFNPGAERLFGYKADEILGLPLLTILPPESRTVHSQKVGEFGREQVNTRAKDARAEIYGMRKSGTIFPVEASICKMDVAGEQYFTAFVRDVTERKLEEERILSMAMTDALTGLANRRYFDIKFNDALAYASRYRTGVALLLIDLDNFKIVNDRYGHQLGDQLLRQVADCLRETLRETDLPSRLGGDEFSVIIHGSMDRKRLVKVAEKLIEGIGRITEVDGQAVQVGATIGISLFPEHGTDAASLIARADQSLYFAKAAGKNTFHIL